MAGCAVQWCKQRRMVPPRTVRVGGQPGNQLSSAQHNSRGSQEGCGHTFLVGYLLQWNKGGERRENGNSHIGRICNMPGLKLPASTLSSFPLSSLTDWTPTMGASWLKDGMAQPLLQSEIGRKGSVMGEASQWASQIHRSNLNATSFKCLLQVPARRKKGYSTLPPILPSYLGEHHVGQTLHTRQYAWFRACMSDLPSTAQRGRGMVTVSAPTTGP